MHSVSRDDCGRFIILDAEKYGHKFSVGNVYFPTRDKESEQRGTLLKFIEALMSFNNEHIIIAGDWNLYLNPRLDKLDDMGESSDNGSYRYDLLSFLETNNLADAWRIFNPYQNFFYMAPWKETGKARLYIYIRTSIKLCGESRYPTWHTVRP